MKYKLSNPQELEQAWNYLNKLTGQEAIVNITKVHPKRTLQQNKYLHVILGIYGLATGYSIEEVKTDWKRYIAPKIFVYEKNGKPYIRSSAEISTKDMTDAIEILRKFAAEQGIDLPSPGEEEKLRHYSNLIEKEGLYL